MRPLLVTLAILIGSPCIGAEFLMRNGSVIRGQYDPDSDATTLRVRVGLPTAYLVKTFRWTDVRAVVLPGGRVGADEFRRRIQGWAGAVAQHHRRLADIDARAQARVQGVMDNMRAAGEIDGPALIRQRAAILADARRRMCEELARYAKARLAIGDEVRATAALLQLLRIDPASGQVAETIGPDAAAALLQVVRREREGAVRRRLRPIAKPTPGRLPHIAMLDVVQAHYADWDYDADADGLVVVLQPRDADGRPVPASGRLSAKLFVRRIGKAWRQVENWNQTVKVEDYGQLGAVVRLEYRVLGRPDTYRSRRCGVLELEFFPNGSDRTVSARVGGLVLEPWVSPFRPYTASRR